MREPYYGRIKRMSQRVLDGFELVVSIGDRRIVVFPDPFGPMIPIRSPRPT